MKQRQFEWFSWSLVGIVMTIPFIAWLQARGWTLERLTIFSVFPLLGMWAWLLMWTHYITGTARLHFGLARIPAYSKRTSELVLALILLHPSLLIFKQFQLGNGLPPKSTLEYVGKSQSVALYFGVISLVIFLSFEVFRRLKRLPVIQRNWKWVGASQALAMILVFVHSLRLGQHLGDDWMQILWILAGLALLPCLIRVLYEDFNKDNERGE